jgi:hypothetical protein
MINMGMKGEVIFAPETRDADMQVRAYVRVGVGV